MSVPRHLGDHGLTQ